MFELGEMVLATPITLPPDDITKGLGGSTISAPSAAVKLMNLLCVRFKVDFYLFYFIFI